MAVETVCRCRRRIGHNLGAAVRAGVNNCFALLCFPLCFLRTAFLLCIGCFLCTGSIVFPVQRFRCFRVRLFGFFLCKRGQAVLAFILSACRIEGQIASAVRAFVCNNLYILSLLPRSRCCIGWLSVFFYCLGFPQFEQNLPVFSVPHAQTHFPAASGFGLPQFEQNLPLFSVPHLPQIHTIGFALPQFEQKFPPVVLLPQLGQKLGIATPDG